MKRFDLLDMPLHGRSLVEAGAGTGKTFAITGLFVRLVVEKGLTVDQILVVTFTQAATEELRHRIRTRIREALDAFESGTTDHADEFLSGLLSRVRDHASARLRLRIAMHSLDEAAIHTIHGFCSRALGDMAFESGSLFDTELATDSGHMFQEVVDDFWRTVVTGSDPALINWLVVNGVTVGKLAEFARKWGFRPGLDVIQKIGTTDIAVPVGEYEEALEPARRCLAQSRDEVLDILVGYPGLNRNRYRKDRMQKLVNEVWNWLASPLPLKPPKSVDRLRASVLGESMNKGASPPAHEFFDLCDALADKSAVLQSALERGVAALKAQVIDYVREEFPRRKKSSNVRTFDDLLMDLDSALHKEGGDALARELRQRHPAALVDEFQDTDPVQYSIFDTIYGPGDSALFFIGDPKQAIYGFRGADVFAYMSARGEVGNDSIRTLDTNWRSVPGLINAVNAVFGRREAPFVFDAIPFSPAVPANRNDRRCLFIDGRAESRPMQLWMLEGGDNGKPLTSTAAEGMSRQATADEIVRLLSAACDGNAMIANEDDMSLARPVEPGDIAVLVRANRQAEEMQLELRARGVPSVLHSEADLFDSIEAVQVHRVLEGVSDPGNEALVKAALVSDVIGASGDDLAALMEDDRQLAALIERFRLYRDTWTRRGFMTMARALMADHGVRGRLLGLPGGERMLTNVLHCFEVLHQASVEQRLGVDGLMEWFSAQIEDRPDRDEHQIRLETDDKAVKLVTIHKAKGLQYPVVFVPFAWRAYQAKEDDDVAVHPSTDDAKMVLDLGSADIARHREMAGREALAEDLRLLYVALTRARQCCYMIWGDVKGSDRSAAAYLLPDDLGDLDRLSKGSIRVAPLPEPTDSRLPSSHEATGELDRRAFKGNIGTDWRISSFSHLVSGVTYSNEAPDRDAVGPGRACVTPSSEGRDAARTIFSFPRGSRAGTCLHEVFEHIDFSSPEKEVVTRGLMKHGFDTKWADVVFDMVVRVLDTPLCDGLALSTVGDEDRVHEMEFTFPLGLLTGSSLSKSLPEHAAALERLGFKPHQGLMKGFIDLVFRQGDRHFLLDWKSNHLGDRPGDYCRDALDNVMANDLYVLQYHIYSTALHRHLASRIKDYDYERHFGGVYYVFLRGPGVFFDRPDFERIEKLDRCFQGLTS